MPTECPQLTVGLVPEGGPNWIAGVIYLENLTRALLTLGADRIDVCFIAGPTYQMGWENNLTVAVPVHRYTHSAQDSWLQAAWNTLKARCLPRTLETVATRTRLRLLFPLQSPPSVQLPVPWIGWIPDFQHKRRPEFFSVAHRIERDTRFRRIVDEATHVVVSSEDARADLMRWFPTSQARVSVLQFRSVLDRAWFDLDPLKVAERFDLPAKFLTYPSQLWAHKNHRTAVEALSLLKARGSTDVVLICTGREYDHRHPEYADALKEEIVRRELQSQVRFLGLLDRATQIQIMRRSAAVVQLSVFEGWSALLEDSRALGKQVLVSDIPVHREQNAHDAVYFNPENAEEFADLIEREWPHLEPGPDLGREQRARENQEKLTYDFACRFKDIVERATRAT